MAKKQIKITVDAPILPEQQDIQHHATSYQVGISQDFTNEDNIIVNNERDEVNKTIYYAEVDVDHDKILFIRCKYHYMVEGVEKTSDWSRIVPINSLQTGLKLSSSIVKTPSVSVEEKEGLIHIHTSDFAMYSGPGGHKASDFLITDTDGEKVFERLDDEDNLTNIYVEDNLKDGKIYSVSARHTNTTNNTSFYGKKLFVNYTPDISLFTFEAPEEFVVDRKFYYKLKIWVNKFKSYDLEIRDTDDQVVFSLRDDSRTTNHILLKDSRLVPNNFYKIYIKLNFTDGTSTEFKNVMESMLLSNVVIPYNPGKVYADKYSLTKTMDTDGITCVTMRETFDGKIIGIDFKTNGVYLYNNVNGSLEKSVQLYEFEKDLALDYVNIIQLPNHDILMDIVVYNYKGQAHTMFLKFEYDPIRVKLNLLKQKIRYDEKYTTSVSNSLAINNSGKCYYIPAYLTNGKTQERTWLKLRKLDLETLEIKDINLPFDIKYFGNISVGRDDNFYVYGGSQFNLYETDAEGMNVERWERHNKEVHVLDVNNETFLLHCGIPENIPAGLYNFQPFNRIDGKLVLFNATWSGDQLDYDKFITFDPVKKEFKEDPINGYIEVPIRSSIVFNNGDIRRITSKIEDPQSVLIYHSDSKAKDEISDIEDINRESADLIVEDGEVIVVEDLYKYDDIIIKGTGIVKWFRPQGITILDSNTLIVNKNCSINQSSIQRANITSILVLDGVDFKIQTSGGGSLPNRPSDTVKPEAVTQ